jgi:tetratricopeptide (TPR) repeat protein
VDNPRLSAEGELALARMALDEGDFRHAADHVAGAIAHAPTMPEVHEVLARLAARTGGGVELFALGDSVYVGTVVARAHLLAAAGRPAEGLDLLAAATGHAPATDWAGVPWVTEPDLARRLDPDHLARVLMQVCAAIPEPVPDTDQAALRPYLLLARHGTAAHPDHGLVLGAASALARRIGEVALAVEWAERGVRAQPSKLGEVWLGYAYRSAGRTADAIGALRRAVAHDPEDLSVYADIAGTLADDGRLDEALQWTDAALAKNPAFDCAVHTAHRLRYRRDRDLAHLVALADFRRDHPDDSHEHTDLAECCHEVPWLGRIPAAPSTVAATSSPSWPSRSSAAERLRQLAHPVWPHPPAAYDAAVALATVEVDDLIGLVARPPALPDTELGRALSSYDPTLWVRCARVWACLGVLHHGTEEPWAASRRRRVLVDLVRGPDAGAAEAALFALVTAAWVDPTARADVAAVMSEHLAGPCPMPMLALATPALPAAAQSLARSLLAPARPSLLRRLFRMLRRPTRR